MDKRKFMRHAKEALRRVLGTDIQKAAPDEEWFFTTLGPARLKTIVSYEREPSYDQHLHVNDELVLKWASVFSWLGIAGQTTFDLIPRGEEEAAAELLAELCGHFLKAAQEIVGQMKTLA